MLGKLEFGLMVCGPAPGMLKTMVSVPACALAAVIASRKVHSVASQPPVPGSAVELTVKITPACGDAAEGPAQAPSVAAPSASSGCASRRAEWPGALDAPSMPNNASDAT